MDTSMVFGIIFAIIVIGLVLAFGGQQIVSLFCVGETAQVQREVREIERQVFDVYNMGTGTTKPYTINLPSNVKLCFLDPQDYTPENYANPLYDWSPQRILVEHILNAPESQYYQSNVWIEYSCTGEKAGRKTSYLRPEKNFCAVDNTRVYMENMGTYVEISLVSES